MSLPYNFKNSRRFVLGLEEPPQATVRHSAAEHAHVLYAGMHVCGCSGVAQLALVRCQLAPSVLWPLPSMYTYGHI